MNASRLWVLVLVPIVAFLVVGCDGDDSSDPMMDAPGDPVMTSSMNPEQFHGAELARPYVMPDVTLEDTSGRPFNLVTDTTSPITLVFFGYTNCPDVCGLVMSDLALATAQLPDAVVSQTQVLFVTTDPDRDTPDVLRTYLDRYDADFIGLTGSLRDIGTAAEAMQVAIEGKKSLPDGGYDVGHGVQVVGFLRDESPVVWTEGWSVGDLVADISELAGS